MPEAPKRHFPVFLDLERRLVVVIGEGPAAEKRVRQLVRHGAMVTVFTPEPSEALLEAEAAGEISVEQRSFVSGDLTGAFVALCITEDEEVQRAVSDEAELIGCLVNVAGEPRYSNFILPSVINRDPLQIAISTGGTAPELAKQLRRQLDSYVQDLWPAWMTLLADVRAAAAERWDDPAMCARACDVAVSEWTRLRLTRGEQVTVEMILDEAASPDGFRRDAEADDEPGRDDVAGSQSASEESE